MPIEGLTELEIINGIFTSIFVFISILIGLRIILKYNKHQIKELITVGISMIFLSTHWWGNSFSFLFYIAFNYELETVTHLIIENIFTPIALILWVYSVCSLAYPTKIRISLLLITPVCIIYYMFLFIGLMVDPEILVIPLSRFDTRSTILLLCLKISALFVFITYTVLFGLNLIKDGDKIIQWKGKFLFLAIGLYSLGGFGSMFLFSLVELVILRLLLILSSILFYFSFFIPDPLRKWLIKNEEL